AKLLNICGIRSMAPGSNLGPQPSRSGLHGAYRFLLHGVYRILLHGAYRILLHGAYRILLHGAYRILLLGCLQDSVARLPTGFCCTDSVARCVQNSVARLPTEFCCTVAYRILLHGASYMKYYLCEQINNLHLLHRWQDKMWNSLLDPPLSLNFQEETHNFQWMFSKNLRSSKVLSKILSRKQQ
ncbi:hypothetical protein J6590_060996, partial [Homalodisca vitripennis]